MKNYGHRHATVRSLRLCVESLLAGCLRVPYPSVRKVTINVRACFRRGGLAPFVIALAGLMVVGSAAAQPSSVLTAFASSSLLPSYITAGPVVRLAEAEGPAIQDSSPAAVVAAARRYWQANEVRILGELMEFLAIPNVFSDPEGIRRNAEWLVAALERRGIEAELLETGGAPYVFGRRRVAGARRTLLFYCHYDGQPVDVSLWVGHDPWDPVVRDGRLADGAAIVSLPESGIDPDWRVYARAAADDRSPIIMILAALDALEAAGLESQANLKFLFQGDEEIGSPYMEVAAHQYRQRWAADLAVIGDGPKHPSGRPTVSFGMRGIRKVQITVYGPKQPLHSGHYGGWAPNPAMRLAHLLASMKDPETGKVLIEGWSEDHVPLSETELASLDTIPYDPADSPAVLGFAAPEGPWERRLEAVTYPGLNVTGLASAWVNEQARSVIPDRAIAELDLRLVPNIQAQPQFQRLIEHIRRQGYHVVSEEPDAEVRARYPRIARVTSKEEGYPGVRTPMDLPIGQAVRHRLRAAFGLEPVAFPTEGGSNSMYVFPDVVGVPIIVMPTVNHDNNQHSPNENVRIGNVWEGIELYALMLTLPFP